MMLLDMLLWIFVVLNAASALYQVHNRSFFVATANVLAMCVCLWAVVL